jgi:plastocyanin
MFAVPMGASTVTGKVQIDSGTSNARSRSDIVVWLETAANVPDGRPEQKTLLQKDKTFHPHVLIVRTGTIVNFPNADPIFHNAFSTFEGQIFDVGLYAPGTNRSVRFRRPGIVRVFCNIHPSMAAVIVVVSTPYFTRLTSTGEYRLTGVPDGSYRVNVYDERAMSKLQKPVAIDVKGDQKKIAAPPIRISEAGYVRQPHKNKFGMDYPPGSDSTGYDGMMK